MVILMRISYCSLGCKVNLYESEAVIQEFIKTGFTLVDFHEKADVVIINTCSITETSDSKSRKMIRSAIRTSPNAVIVVMGCYAQLKPDAVCEIPGVDLLIGTQYRSQIFPMVMDILRNRHQISKVDDISRVKTYEELKVSRFTDKTRGFVKIEDGCDNFCSYCTIPYARGRVRSRASQDVIEEIRLLSDEGVKEIVLSGINTGCYGQDLDHYTLIDLLRDLIKNIPNLGKLRISSIELTEITSELLQLIKDNPSHFCMHFHIPLQGGHNETLKRMNRKYTLETYISCISNIRSLFPNVNITTDVMVGFSGETDANFQETLANICQIGFGEMHVFPYSRRPLTKAYHFPDIVSESIKKERMSAMLALNETMAHKYRLLFKDQILPVLVEKCENGTIYGHTSNYLEVQIDGICEVNTFVFVKLANPGYPISKGVLYEL